jgi:lysophospholipase L1-like esterase
MPWRCAMYSSRPHALFCGESEGRQARMKWLRALWVVVRLALISMIAAELFLRFFKPVEFRAPEPELPAAERAQMLFRRSSVPGLPYEMAPNMEKIADGVWVRTNGYGMRDREPLPDDTPSLFRIVAIGDSFAFGLGVPVEEAFPRVLEKLLNDSATNGMRYEVLNLAVPGYSTWEEALALKYKGLKWHPKLVVLGYCLNDPETEPLQPLDLYFHRPSWWEHSHLLRLFALWHTLLDTKIHGGGDYYFYLHSPQRKNWQSVVDAFRDIGNMVRLEGGAVLLVIFPINEVNSWSEYRYRPIHQQVAAAAKAEGFHVLDLYDVYAQHEPKSLRVAPADHHPDALGHALAAQAIKATLVNEGLLTNATGHG